MDKKLARRNMIVGIGMFAALISLLAFSAAWAFGYLLFQVGTPLPDGWWLWVGALVVFLIIARVITWRLSSVGAAPEADHAAVHDSVDSAHGDPGEIHLPPNSFVPVFVAIGLAITFVGFLDQIRVSVGPLVWGFGLAVLIGSLIAWVRAARAEFLELPDSGGH